MIHIQKSLENETYCGEKMLSWRKDISYISNNDIDKFKKNVLCKKCETNYSKMNLVQGEE